MNDRDDQKPSTRISGHVRMQLPALSSVTHALETKHKENYSHGFEDIYALQNVDLSSVRPVTGSTKNNNSTTTTDLPDTKEGQLTLDFGPGWRGWMPSLSLHEPLQVLGLSRPAEEGLLENGVRHLHNLIGMDKSDFIGMKGVGQGHIDEVLQKLQEHLGAASPAQSTSVDFVSLLRCLYGDMEPLQAYLLLEPYGFHDIITLSTADAVTVRHMNSEARSENLEEAREQALKHKRRQFVRETFRDLASEFLIPWIEERGGIASLQEIHERLRRCSSDPTTTEAVLTFVQDLYFEGSVFDETLVSAGTELFAVNKEALGRYQSLIRHARSYFYARGQSYWFEELESFLLRDFARKDVGFPDSFIEKVLRLSNDFRVRKGSDGRRSVRLS